MEAIKVSIDINVELSESTKQFLAAMLNPMHGAQCCNVGCESRVPEAPAAPAAPAPEPTPSKPAPAAIQAPAAPAAPAVAQNAEAEVTIEMVRKVVAAKSGTHKEELRAKLTECGAKNVSTLEPAKYKEFYEFAKAL